MAGEPFPEPEVVYHYTDAGGIDGIVSNGELWATEIRYLNDSSEFEHLFSLLRERTASIPSIAAQARDLMDAVQKVFADTARIYVACFCESGDLLSQWRGYAGGSGGFAIGFKWRELQNARSPRTDGDPRWTFDRVVYDPIEQNEKIDEILVTSMRAVLSDGIPDDATPERIHELEAVLLGTSNFRLSLTAPTFKSHGFVEEQERRAIHLSTKDLAQSVYFRSTAVGLTPYIKLDVTGSERRVPLISDIVIGPTPHPNLAESAVKLLLRKAGFEDGEVAVRHSEIPFRS